MKITIIYFALIFTTILPVVSCIGQESVKNPQAFEGELIMNIEQGGVKTVVYYTIKGDHIRTRMGTLLNPSYEVLKNQVSKESTIFLKVKGKKVAVKMAEEMMQQGLNEVDTQDQTQSGRFTFEVADETKMIGKYKCVKVIGKSDQVESISWMTKDLDIHLDDIVPLDLGLKGQAQQDALKKYSEMGFVLEMEKKSLTTGKKIYIKCDVEEQAVDDAVFAISEEEYYYFDMTDLEKLIIDTQAEGNVEKMQILEELLKGI